jgi:hypothetical protein
MSEFTPEDTHRIGTEVYLRIIFFEQVSLSEQLISNCET